MKKILVFSLVCMGLFSTADAAVSRPTGRNARADSAAGANSAEAGKTTAARAAVNARSGTRAQTTAPVQTGNVVNRGRAATNTASKVPTVSARAATTQKVIGTGTKVAGAAKNIVVSEECQAKFDGCMDSFCMLDNETGGRCICSDRNEELDSILAEIEKLDQQSYQMATFGVEKIEMGVDAESAIANANAVAQSVLQESEKKSVRKSLDLSMWDMAVDFDTDEDIFGSSAMSSLAGKEGDALYRAATQLCVNQIPECGTDLDMLQLMYAQRIKSDCAAYENSLKQQKSASQQKLSTAERALREAALEQLRTANKYDLGQCTIEFKKCMQTTAGCGNDFAGCASVAAMDSTNVVKSTSKKSKSYQIKGAVTNIEITASTYDTLLSKKPLCETVTKSCVAVADQVWDTFLREVAPQVKSAEIIAEDNLRQNCVGNISSCFQKACKENMDPKDPDGSYDLCLTRPGTMLNLCKVPLNACGIDASSESAAEQSNIWDYVLARLASMRVDSCTTAVKECLQSEDRCGEDYSQCIGLDTDTIVRMCPYDKLVGCQQKYGASEIKGDAVYDELATMVQGIMLNIDNSFLVQCQKAVDEAMIKICGDTENCNAITTEEGMGARSLEYKICEYTNSSNGLDINYSACRTDVSQILDTELGRVEGSTSTQLGPVKPFAGVIDGTIYWEAVDIDDDGRVMTVDDYLTKIGAGEMSATQKEKVKSELAVLQKNIDLAVDAIEADSTVQFCMTGREVQGMKTGDADSRVRTHIGEKSADAARFPELTKQVRMLIANAALKKAKDNYYKRYDEINEKMLQDYATLGERMAEIQGKNALDARREIARQACVNFADMSSLPKSPEPPKSAFGKIAAMVAVVGAVVAVPFTGGLSVVAVGGVFAASTGAVVAGGAAAVAGVGLLGNAGSGKANGDDVSSQLQLIGSKQMNQWNYKETVTSTFEWETLKCERCIRAQDCIKTKNPLFGKKYCKDWGEETNTCTTTQF
ncbi:MAG: hypothetical protein IKW57_01590 [Alphaproteobacteria bacterium]|nr:hypothetical protein [Alphaproteobacteria bacterium]